MKYEDCQTCSYFKYTKYPTPYCENIMMPISDIDKCPKCGFVQTETKQMPSRNYENLSYSEKLKIGFDMLSDENE